MRRRAAEVVLDATGVWWRVTRGLRERVLDLGKLPWAPWRCRVADLLERAAWIGNGAGCWLAGRISSDAYGADGGAS